MVRAPVRPCVDCSGVRACRPCLRRSVQGLISFKKEWEMRGTSGCGTFFGKGGSASDGGEAECRPLRSERSAQRGRGGGRTRSPLPASVGRQPAVPPVSGRIRVSGAGRAGRARAGASRTVTNRPPHRPLGAGSARRRGRPPGRRSTSGQSAGGAGRRGTEPDPPRAPQAVQNEERAGGGGAVRQGTGEGESRDRTAVADQEHFSAGPVEEPGRAGVTGRRPRRRGRGRGTRTCRAARTGRAAPRGRVTPLRPVRRRGRAASGDPWEDRDAPARNAHTPWPR